MAFRVRAARPQDRAQWCELTGRAGPDAEAAWWDAHEKDPSWRLLIAENGKLVGKTAARLIPGYGVQVAMPRVKKGAPVEEVARALLESALTLRQEGPYPMFEFKLNDRTQDLEHLRKAAEGLGFGVSEERFVVERPLANLQRANVPFACRTLTELGDEVFLPVFQKADKDRVKRAANYRPEDEWAHVKSLPGFDPDWAYLATKAGEPIGYAITNLLGGPSPEDSIGVMSYVGILPEKRGQGHGTALVAYALSALRRRGATLYRDVVPAGNAAMRHVLAKNGCREVGREWIYRRAVAA